MLIIPLSHKLSWKNPPFLTILLILINCFVLIFIQSGDNEKRFEAAKYYFESGLADIEIDRFLSYREGEGLGYPDLGGAKEGSDEEAIGLYMAIKKDHRFLKKLKKDQIVTPEDPDYQNWKDLRRQYDAKETEVVSETYGFKPAYHEPITFVTTLFLHGGFGHLIGNMLFLWFFGCMLEIGSGRVMYTALYLISGVAATALFWLFNMGSYIPLIGASGAISGLMGGYAVLYGLTRVKIFLTLGFYFNYLKFPAILLLPVFIGKEIYFQLSAGGVSSIAYMAHLGGMIAGAVIGLMISKISGVGDKTVFEDEDVDEISPLIDKAVAHMAELDFDKSRELLGQVLAKEPDNIPALKHLYNVEKQNPANKAFHDIAGRLLTELVRHADTASAAHEVFKEYARLARPPRIPPDLYIRLSILFASAGFEETAKNILAVLLKKKPNLPGIPTALLRLARAYRAKGKQDNWIKCKKILSKRYPQSSEARLIAKMP